MPTDDDLPPHDFPDQANDSKHILGVTMPLNVTLEIPPDIEAKLRQESTNLDFDVREAYALELYRQGRLSHFELARLLGLDHCDTDTWLKRHGVFGGAQN
jgi:predicted HTH domain antitoxin